jgi:hypothetical protein
VQNNREEQLLRQLEEGAIVDVLGVVAPSGVAGTHSRDEPFWMLQFGLAAWKHPGGSVQNRELRLRKQVPESEINGVQEQLSAYDIVHLRARVMENSVFGTPEGLLVEILGIHTSDDDLNRSAQELQKPVTFHDHQFGVFTLDRRIDWYEARTAWGSTPVRLHLSMENHEDANERLNVLVTARSLWDSCETWTQRVTDCAVAELLDLKNDAWLEEGEPELSAEQFKSRMTLESLTVYAGGRFEFWYHDGDLFWGHLIRVSGSLSKGPDDAGIEG